MNKNDLKDGHLVELRNGTISIVFDGVLHSKRQYDKLSNYHENLKCHPNDAIDFSDFDIMKVGTSNLNNIFARVSRSDLINWIWEREVFQLTQSEYDLLKFLDERAVWVVKKYDYAGEVVLYITNIRGVHKADTVLLENEFNALEHDQVYKISDILNNHIIKENDNE